MVGELKLELDWTGFAPCAARHGTGMAWHGNTARRGPRGTKRRGREVTEVASRGRIAWEANLGIPRERKKGEEKERRKKKEERSKK